MGKKVKEFKAGDFIFAKVKGYPAWPARVQGITGKKYFVFFYGTREIANLPPNMIFDYAENKDKFLSKSVKRKDFNDGVKQIEHDFANNVPLEDVVGTVPAFEKANASLNDTTMDETVDEANTTADDTSVGDQSMDVDETASERANEKTAEESDEAGTLVIDEGKKGAKKKGLPREVSKTPKSVRSSRSSRRESREEEKKEEEVTSRSGRKIKPKRYIDEESEDLGTSTPVSKRRRGATPEQPRLPEPLSSASPSHDPEPVTVPSTVPETRVYTTVNENDIADLKEVFSSETVHNLLVTRLPSGVFVGVKLFQDRPNSFKSEVEQLQWERQSAKNSITLKHELEDGITAPKSVAAQIELDLKLTDDEKEALDWSQDLDTRTRVRFLKVEMDLLDLDAKIRGCLGTKTDQCDKSVEYVDEMLALEITPLMLMKHQCIMETIRRMRHFVGNEFHWGTPADKEMFDIRAKVIRDKAESAYAAFRHILKCPPNQQLKEHYKYLIREYKKHTDNMSEEETIEIVKLPEGMLKSARKLRKPADGSAVPKKRKKSTAGHTSHESGASDGEMNDHAIDEDVPEDDEHDVANNTDFNMDVDSHNADISDVRTEDKTRSDAQEKSKDGAEENADKDADNDIEKDANEDNGNNKDTGSKDDECKEMNAEEVPSVNNEEPTSKSPAKQKGNDKDNESTESQNKLSEEADSTAKDNEQNKDDNESTNNQTEQSLGDDESIQDQKEPSKEKESSRKQKEATKEKESSKNQKEPSKERESTKNMKEPSRERSSRNQKEPSKEKESTKNQREPSKEKESTKNQKEPSRDRSTRNQKEPSKERESTRNQKESSKDRESTKNMKEPSRERSTRSQKEPSKEREPTKNQKEPSKERESTKNQKEPSKERESTKNQKEPSKERESTKNMKEPSRERSTRNQKEPSKERESTKNQKEPSKERESAKNQKEPSKERESTKNQKEPSKERESTKNQKERSRERSTRNSKDKESSIDREFSRRESSRNKSVSKTRSESFDCDVSSKMPERIVRTPTKSGRSPRISLDSKSDRDDNGSESGRDRESSSEPKSKRIRAELPKKPEAASPQSTPSKRKSRS